MIQIVQCLRRIIIIYTLSQLNPSSKKDYVVSVWFSEPKHKVTKHTIQFCMPFFFELHTVILVTTSTVTKDRKQSSKMRIIKNVLEWLHCHHNPYSWTAIWQKVLCWLVTSMCVFFSWSWRPDRSHSIERCSLRVSEINLLSSGKLQRDIWIFISRKDTSDEQSYEHVYKC